MASVKPEKLKLFEQLQKGRRSLGEGNEIVLLGQGPGCLMRLIFGLLLMVCGFVGVLRGLGDCLISLAPAKGTGTVTLVEYANAEINERELYCVWFEVREGNATRAAYSYTTDSTPSEGSDAQIERCTFLPSLMRIKGMRMSVFGSLGFLILAPIMLAFAVGGWKGLRRTLRWRHLLREGTPNWARLTSKEPTNVSINEQPVFKLIFTYESSHNQSHTIELSEHRQAELQALQDEGEELMLYDPHQPEIGLIWDQLPCRLKLDRNGIYKNPKRADVVLSIVVILITYGSLFIGLNEFIRIFRGG